MITKTIAAMTAIAATVTGGAQAPSPQTLSAARDHYRPLLIFAGPHDNRVEEQWNIITQHDHDVVDRQILTVLLSKSRTKMHDGTQAPLRAFPATEEHLLRQRFHIKPNEFAVLLIGKDGAEKLRFNQPVSWTRLQTLIDSMPMRQSEMRQTAR